MATQIELSKASGIGQGHLSDILRGVKPIGRETAQKLERFTQIRWVEFLDMGADEVKKAMEEAYKNATD